MKFKIHLTIAISPDAGELAAARKIMQEIDKALMDVNYNPHGLLFLLTGATHDIKVSPIPANLMPLLTARELAAN